MTPVGPAQPPPSDPRQAVVARLLLWLDRHAVAERRRSDVAPALTQTANDMAAKYIPLTDRALDQGLRAVGPVDFQDRHWVYGPRTPPLGGGPGLLPVVSVRWDWSPPVRLRLLVALVGVGSAPLAAVGYRYETPDAISVQHDYHHVQPADRLGRHRTGALHGVPAALDTSVPAVPVSATGPVGLTLAMLLSLYGSKRLNVELFQERALRESVAPYLHEMPVLHARYATPPPPAQTAGHS